MPSVPKSATMTTTSEVYGQVVREFRKRAGLTQGQLATLISVRQATVSRWERNEREVPLELVEEITKACGFSYDDFLARVDELNAALLSKPPPPPTGHVTDGAGLDAWTTRVIADGPDDPNLKLLLFVLQNYVDKTSWVVSGTIPQIAASASLPVGMVEDLWEELLASPFVERVGSGEWTLRLVVPGEGAER